MFIFKQKNMKKDDEGNNNSTVVGVEWVTVMHVLNLNLMKFQ